MDRSASRQPKLCENKHAQSAKETFSLSRYKSTPTGLAGSQLFDQTEPQENCGKRACVSIKDEVCESPDACS